MSPTEDDEGAATRAWRASDDAPLHLPTRRRRRVYVIGAVLAAGVAVAVTVALVSGGNGADTASRQESPASATPASTGVVSPPDATPEPQLPPWVRVTVERVRVAAGTTAWDGPTEEASLKDQCRGLAGLGGLVNAPAGAGLGLLCGLVDDPQRQTDPTWPDLQLMLEVSGTRYPSLIAFDQLAFAFGYSFAIPAQAIPKDGLLLTVVDADLNSERGQEIGSVRITKDELIAAVESGRLLSLQPSGLELLEVMVEAYDGAYKKQLVKLDTSKGGSTVRGFPVNAGDIIRIEASGQWQIGTYWNDLLGPAGYPGGGPKGSNLDLFPNEPHGAAVAVVGSSGKAHTVAVDPCVKFVAKYAGVVWVGINDRKFGDNEGQAEFAVKKRGSKAAQWLNPGARLACD